MVTLHEVSNTKYIRTHIWHSHMKYMPWNLMLILISNSQRLETKSPCKSANYFEGIQCRIPKTAYGYSWHFASLCPLWDSFVPPFMAKCTQGT